jgi:hypothetical protein
MPAEQLTHFVRSLARGTPDREKIAMTILKDRAREPVLVKSGRCRPFAAAGHRYDGKDDHQQQQCSDDHYEGRV